MADIGVNAQTPTSKLQALKDRQAYQGWQMRLTSIEVQREEYRISLARLEEEEISLQNSIREYETKYNKREV